MQKESAEEFCLFVLLLQHILDTKRYVLFFWGRPVVVTNYPGLTFESLHSMRSPFSNSNYTGVMTTIGILIFRGMLAILNTWNVEDIIWTTAFSIILVTSILGNTLVLWTVLAHRRMWSLTNYFLVNLAAADLGMAMFNCIPG